MSDCFFFFLSCFMIFLHCSLALYLSVWKSRQCWDYLKMKSRELMPSHPWSFCAQPNRKVKSPAHLSIIPSALPPAERRCCSGLFLPGPWESSSLWILKASRLDRQAFLSWVKPNITLLCNTQWILLPSLQVRIRSGQRQWSAVWVTANPTVSSMMTSRETFRKYIESTLILRVFQFKVKLKIQRTERSLACFLEMLYIASR